MVVKEQVKVKGEYISIRLYKVTLDDFSKELVMSALMEKALSCKKGSKVRENYLTVYGDLKEEMGM